LNEVDNDVWADMQQHLGAFASNFRVNELQSLAGIVSKEVACVFDAIVIS
jgi:hypothetical protein